MIVQNMDIAGLVRRLRRFKFEVHKCNSAGLMFTTEKDLGRFDSYLEALLVYFDWMVSQPMQDLPESHPTDIDLGESEKFTLPENEALADLIQQLEALEQEIFDSTIGSVGTRNWFKPIGSNAHVNHGTGRNSFQGNH